MSDLIMTADEKDFHAIFVIKKLIEFPNLTISFHY